ncbi:MAG: hypothetical protein J0L88_09025 [Xanthomonadales bacterium]|nr:hypothetical protein [Xanthomonadales bacterium]
MRIPSALAGTFAATLALSMSPMAHAAIYRIGSGAGCTHATIQAAIDAAVATAEGDEIRLGATQYNVSTLSIGATDGPLTVSGGYASCLATSPAAGQRAVLIGNGSGSVVRVRNVQTLQLANLDIRQGSATEGGGIDVQGSPSATDIDVVALSNTLVRSNGALRGGGIGVKNTLGTNAQPGNLQVLLYGDSSVTSNTATDDGGGIRCEHATVMLFDRSHVGLNTSSEGAGGGIHGLDCRLQLTSRGVSGNGAVLWSNSAPAGLGGGMFLRGSQASVDIMTIDAIVPARIVGNSALAGGGIGVNDAAQVRLYDTILQQNSAAAYGGAILVSNGSGVGQSRLSMLHADAGSPSAAVACADAEACNLVRSNRVDPGTGPFGRAGAGFIAFASAPDRVRVDFRGTRFDFNDGTTLAHLDGSGARAVFNGALLVDNLSTDGLIFAQGGGHAIDVSSSTLASNSLGEGNAVIRAAGACSASGGLQVRHSIVWQPQRALVEPTAAIDPACFSHLISADFGVLPAAADRVVADPLFLAAASGNFQVFSASPALDFAPPRATDATRDGAPRVMDLADRTDRFGPQDVGAYERFEDRLFKNGFDCETC